MSIMIIIAITLSILLIIISYTISHKSNYPITFSGVNDEGERRSQYECGLETLEEEIGKETRERFYIKFYIIGILFLIFDLETLLLFPASLIFYSPLKFSSSSSSLLLHSDLEGDRGIYEGILIENNLMYKSFSVLFTFILILLLGLIYEYRKNVL